MTNSEDISRSLGGIQSTVTETQRQVSSLFEKFEKINEEVIEQRGAMKMLARTAGEIKVAHDGLAIRVKEDVMPVLQEYTASKNRLLGAMFGTGLAGGGIGTGVVIWFQKLLGFAPTLPPSH